MLSEEKVFIDSLDLKTIEEALNQGRILPILVEVDGHLLSTEKYGPQEGMYRVRFGNEDLVISENGKQTGEEVTIALAKNNHIEISFIKKFLLEWGVPHLHIYTMISVYSEDKQYHFVWSGYEKTAALLEYFRKKMIPYQVEENSQEVLLSELDDEQLKRQIELNGKIKVLASDKLVFPL